MIEILRRPDALHIEHEDGWKAARALSRDGWESAGVVRVQITVLDASCSLIQLEASSERIRRIHLRWQGMFDHPQVLGDHWERGYGDLGWQTIVPERVLPWYVMVHEKDITYGYGVKTGASALCHWLLDDAGLSLILDVRSGNQGVALGTRVLDVATLVMSQGHESDSPFLTTRQFCRMLCDAPRLPPEPVYGGNNWYYAYGSSSHQEIVDDAKRIASWSPDATNRPYMVIDDGWQLRSGGGACNGGPWVGNAKFPDMEGLAREISELGVRPGIWVRPLLTDEQVPEAWIRSRVGGAQVLDPSHPDVLAYVHVEIQKLVGWGYQLIKHDFTSFDIFDQWGYEMHRGIGMRTRLYDGSRTTAEIVCQLYKVIAEASGQSVIIGCNTIGHLGAGLFEIQRTGDDTSGREWERTRKMGINTLAFRMPQHDTFFSADADCVGITKDIPWHLNRQWLELLSGSGTPLFISADPHAVGPTQEVAIRRAFARASRPLPVAEPLDWLQTTCPSRWRLDGQEVRFDWFGTHGVTPIYDRCASP